VARLGLEHEAQLSQLLVSLDQASRANRFGHPASDACVQAYAKSALTTATFMAGTFGDGTLVGIQLIFDGWFWIMLSAAIRRLPAGRA
jgi:uncharacterized membrane protein HdeD (DUF308 family)